MNWQPIVGERFNRFITEQPLEARKSIQASSIKILSRCRKPGEMSIHQSHLIVGEVQSGKTMSFTGVTALARDNGFSLIIVIGGTKQNLLEQTILRLNRDLHIDGDGGANPWMLCTASDLRTNEQEINKVFDQWNDNNLPDDFKRTLVVATLKTKASLDKLRTGLEKLGRNDLADKSVLIIDDEADQAGLNIASEIGDESSVYAALGRLRKFVPNNDYLMYTATPQATLLLQIEDHLAPDTVTVLESGEMYIGGRDLFGEGNTFVMPIPLSDISQATDPQPALGPPKSLKTSLSYFLVTMAIAQKRGNPKPCSMLIHPGTTKTLHSQYQIWVNAILLSWSAMLTDPSELAFQDCVENDFSDALDWIHNSVEIEKVWPAENIISRNIEILKYVSHWISQIDIRVVNSDKDAKGIKSLEWKSKAGWIVIGGAKLERGFTIENLTTTYMPRGTGVGNADSIQQRGRFFGYKRKYFDVLKGWLDGDLIEAFRVYVEHEDSMRTALSVLDQENSPVSSWRRKFYLDPALRPTRTQVIKLLIKHDKLVKGFVFRQHQLFEPRMLGGQGEMRQRFESMMLGADVHVKDTRKSADVKNHLVKKISLSDAVNLLLDIPASGDDRANLDAKIFALQNLIDEEISNECEIVFMDELNPRERSAVEMPNVEIEELRIENLMAGRTANYDGDEKLVSPDLITIQIHCVTPKVKQNVLPAVFAAAIHWPQRMRAGVVWETPGQR